MDQEVYQVVVLVALAFGILASFAAVTFACGFLWNRYSPDRDVDRGGFGSLAEKLWGGRGG